jgi:hypothetical protein
MTTITARVHFHRQAEQDHAEYRPAEIESGRHQTSSGRCTGRRRRTVRLASAVSAAGAAPQVSGDIGLGLLQKVELRLDKREGCRKQAEAQGLGMLERIQFVRK